MNANKFPLKHYVEVAFAIGEGIRGRTAHLTVYSPPPEKYLGMVMKKAAVMRVAADCLRYKSDEDVLKSPSFESARTARIEMLGSVDEYIRWALGPTPLKYGLKRPYPEEALSTARQLEEIIRAFNKSSGRLPDDGLPLPVSSE